MKNPSPKIVLVTSLKPPLRFCWNQERGQALALIRLHSEVEQANAYKGRSRKAGRHGQGLLNVSKSLPWQQPRSSTHSALLSSNQPHVHSQPWASAHTGSSGTLLTPPTEHSLHARHCGKCSTLAIPLCPNDVIRWLPLLHFTGEETRAGW